jgi:hypothetical protein
MNQKAEFEVLRNNIWEPIDNKNLKINDIVRYKNYPETTYTITSEYLTNQDSILYMEMILDE